MGKDTEFETGTPGVDAAYSRMANRVEHTPEPDRKVGNEPLPKFSFYVVKPITGKGAFTKTGLMVGHFGFQVKLGPDGTVGRSVYDDLVLQASQTVDVPDPDDPTKTITRPRTEAEIESAESTIADSAARFTTRAGFAVRYPASNSQEDLDLFAAQVGESPDLVVELRVQGGGDKYEPRNRVNWLSIARCDDPAKYRRGKQRGQVIPGKTCLDEALEEIEAYNKRQDAKPAGRAGTVGAALSPSEVV